MLVRFFCPGIRSRKKGPRKQKDSASTQTLTPAQILTSLVSVSLGVEQDRNESGQNEDWSRTVAGVDGCIYGIPHYARRVVKFNPVDKSIHHIGPDLGGGAKFSVGVLDDKGCIYCLPGTNSLRQILKIDTNPASSTCTDTGTNIDAGTGTGTDTDNVDTEGVTLLEHVLPERGLWMSGALAMDGKIYCMPYTARRILKIDPYNDTAETILVGEDLGNELYLYLGTIAGSNGEEVYGIPQFANCFIKYNIHTGNTSVVGTKTPYRGGFAFCSGNGVLGRDNNIYIACDKGQVMKIDTSTSTRRTASNNGAHSIVGNTVVENAMAGSIGSRRIAGSTRRWCDGVLGVDGCIYWPPRDAKQTLKYDPVSNMSSLVGLEFGNIRGKWNNGVHVHVHNRDHDHYRHHASDGIIYCLPSNAKYVLRIDAYGYYVSSLERDMERYPEKLGLIFESKHDNRTNSEGMGTLYENAMIKFGEKRGFQTVVDCLPPSDKVLGTTAGACRGFYPYALAASLPNSSVSIIYHLLRQDPSLLHV